MDSPVLHCRNLIIDLALACRSISSDNTDDWTSHLSSAVVGKEASSFILGAIFCGSIKSGTAERTQKSNPKLKKSDSAVHSEMLCI